MIRSADRLLPLRAARNIAGCLWLLVLLSYVRSALSWNLKVDNVPFAYEQDEYFPWLVGATLAVAGWQYLKAMDQAGRLPMRVLLRVALVLQALTFPALPFTSNDVFSNLAYGAMRHRGLSPYLQVPADLGSCDPFRIHVGVWVETGCVYGPVAAAMNDLSIVGGVVASLVAFKILAFLAGIAVVLGAWRFCDTALPAHRAGRAFVRLAWNPMFLWEVAGQAHNDVLIMLGLLGFAWAVTAGRPWLATVGLAFAFLAKFSILPVVLLFLFWQFRVSPARSLGLTVFFLLLVVLIFAPYWDGPRTMDPFLRGTADSLEHVTQSVAEDCKMFGAYMGDDLGKRWAWGTYTVAMKILLLAGGLWFAHRVRTASQVLRYSLAFMLALQCVGLGWFMTWYTPWLLPLAMAVEDRVLQRAVAWYTVLCSDLYLPGNNATDVFRLVVHLTPIWMLWRRRYILGPVLGRKRVASWRPAPVGVGQAT